MFFFNDTATTEIYTLSLHDALPIFGPQAGTWEADDAPGHGAALRGLHGQCLLERYGRRTDSPSRVGRPRSEEHTSELQSRQYLVCRLLLEKKNTLTFALLSQPESLN